MEFRNALLIDNGIDCEANHPHWGWIPTTLRPDDEPTADMYWEVKAWLDAQPVVAQDE